MIPGTQRAAPPPVFLEGLRLSLRGGLENKGALLLWAGTCLPAPPGPHSQLESHMSKAGHKIRAVGTATGARESHDRRNKTDTMILPPSESSFLEANAVISKDDDN